MRRVEVSFWWIWPPRPAHAGAPLLQFGEPVLGIVLGQVHIECIAQEGDRNGPYRSAGAGHADAPPEPHGFSRGEMSAEQGQFKQQAGRYLVRSGRLLINRCVELQGAELNSVDKWTSLSPAVSVLGQPIEISYGFAPWTGQPKSLKLLAIKGESDTAGLRATAPVSLA